MRYSMKKILSTSALALILGFGYVNLCSAQGIVSLSENAKADDKANEIPDEISLFGDEPAEVKVITPAKSTSGVKSAAELLGNKNTEKKTAPQKLNSDTNVKSAKELLAPKQNSAAGGVKSAAELLGNVPNKNQAQPAGAQNNVVSKTAEKKAAETKESSATVVLKAAQSFESPIVKDVEDTVFDKMSDLEKQTAILNLELKKEKVKSDIESLKAVQEKAKEEEKARQEEKKRKIQAWENEEKRKLLQEQQKLKSLEIAYEKQRQEKLLKNYKNKMLEQTQENIASREAMYKEIADLKEERQHLINDFKGRFLQLTQMADQTTSDAIRIRDEYAKTISDLQTQISILTARLEANDKKNPFAETQTNAKESENKTEKLSDQYAVMEVRGQGGALMAKLINESGVPFFVKVGTVLQSGHVVDEITTTYVRADKEGSKDYLYFSAGGILDKEPAHNEDLKIKVSPSKDAPVQPTPAVMTTGIPSVASEMTIR